MAERTEEQLVRALRAAADLAPQPIGDLTVGIAVRRRRRRRRRMQTLLAATAAVAVIGTGMTVMRGTFLEHRGGADVATEARASLTPAAPPVAPQRFDPAAEVWPEAVFRIPAKSRDGLEYRPLMALSATEVLLAAESAHGESDRLEVYDSSTESIWMLTSLPGMFTKSSAQGWDADSRNIVWYTTYVDAEGTPLTRFWLLSRKGGRPSMVFFLHGEDADKVAKLAVAEDRIAWSLSTGGVFTAPLEGSKRATRIPGSEGLFLQQWPWASDKPDNYANDPGGNQSLLVNLATGERRSVRAGDAQRLRCGPNWCVGERSDDQRRMSAVVQRVDGGERQELPLLRSFPTLDGIVDDRFAVLTVSSAIGWNTPGETTETEPPPVAVVYDRVTGAKAAVGARGRDGGGSFGRGTSSAPSNIVYWNAGRSSKPKEYVVLNLAAIR
ncbi:hypothetical protein AB0K60_26135 [Thermopolyspora sp. NPDC052614]|uniref:hypothetical protein n=1 Tax=Thermopolyspora sp. NPDC052614 TaxID=3155682 RepID=UPI00342516AE